MVNKIKIILGVLALCIGFAQTASACQAPRFTKAELKLINPKRINQGVFGTAATKVTNYYRCRAGRDALKHDRKLVSVSADLAKRMARKNSFFHDPSLKPRYRRYAVRTKIYGENIGQDYLMHHQDRIYLTRDNQNCKFVFRDTKEPVKQHSYASFAMRMVTLWWESPSHRKIINDRRYGSVGTAIGYSRKKDTLCGYIYAAQNFAD